VKRGPVLLLGAGALLLAAGAAAWRGSRPSPSPSPPPPSIDEGETDHSPPLQESTLDARAYRSRDEVILLARLAVDGRPASGVEVLLVDAAGEVRGTGATDGRGVFRGRFTGDPREALLRVRGGKDLLLPIPPAPPPSAPPRRPLLSDRSVLRPGDRFRVCAWSPDPAGAPLEASVRYDPPVPGAPEEEAAFEEAGTAPGRPASGPGWQVLAWKVPPDAPPGRALVAIGGDRLEIPLVPRFGPAVPAPTAPPAPPEEPSRGDPALRREDGAWRVDLGGPLEGAPVLVFGAAGGRFLGHGAVLAEGSEALVPLPEDSADREVTVTAVIARPDGFREHRSTAAPPGPVLRFDPLPGGVRVGLAAQGGIAAPPLRAPVPLAVAVDDPASEAFLPLLMLEDAGPFVDLPLSGLRGGALSLRAAALPRGGAPLEARATLVPPEPAPPSTGPSWRYGGDVPADPAGAPPAREFRAAVRAFLPAGTPTALPDSLPIPPGTPVAWTAVGCTGPGALRLRAGRTILLETSVDDGLSTGAMEAGPGRALAAPLLASSDAPGFEGLLLDAEVPADPAALPEDAAPGLRIERLLPGRAGAGTEAEAVLVLRAEEAFEGPLEAACPLPRGTVPAEDGWAVRERGPEGVRVRVAEDEALWSLPRLAAGETRLRVRVRALWRGRWAAPPARVSSEDPTGPSARSAGAVLAIE